MSGGKVPRPFYLQYSVSQKKKGTLLGTLLYNLRKIYRILHELSHN
jgi:hypothetical protein